MLTRQGIVVVFAGLAAAIVGRVFAVVELFVISAGLLVAVAFALIYVHLRRPRVDAVRWIHPSILVAGDTGRVDIHLDHRGSVRSAPFTLCEHVQRTMGDPHNARLPIAALAANSRTSSGYRLPSAVRGLIELGPLTIELTDPLGIASTSTVIADLDEVVVAPRALMLDMPQLGQGVLGAALLDRARRLGPGDFHGLREYAIGDEPRTIHWRASARSDTLMVKEHTVEGLHRCTVVFDAAPGSHASPASFERGITAAASLVNGATRAGLTTRFVTAGGIDLRGPDVTPNTMRVLARIAPDASPTASLDRDTGDGLGLLIVVTGSRRGATWRAAQAVSDPTSTVLAVTTDEAASTRLSVAARSEDEFLGAWQSLVGRGRLDLTGGRS
ncbi:MAG: DUF58 domain-containing protein [Ilumatobacteraceae bacterium]